MPAPRPPSIFDLRQPRPDVRAGRVADADFAANKGFADIALALEPMVAQYPALRYGCLIELKYIKGGDDARDAKVQEAGQDAERQLQGYLGTTA